MGIDPLVNIDLLGFYNKMNGDNSLLQKCAGEKMSLPQKGMYIEFLYLC